MASFHNNSILFPIILFILVLLSTAARHTITPTQALADNETLVSYGGTFALGFFTPYNSERRYIGIWYYNATSDRKTIVWVANQASPVTRSTGQLSVTAKGTITITNRNSTVVWSAGGSVLTNPVVELLDTGNFVLKEDEDDDTEKYAWQSFDYPTDTLLPGMKLGVDYVAGLNRNLTAWKSEDDPSPGEYYAAMVIGNNSPEMYLFDMYRSGKVWRSEPWDGNQFEGIPINRGYPYSFVNNNEEVTFSFEARYYTFYNKTVLPLLQVTYSGHMLQQVRWFQWIKQWEVPENPCEGIGLCGNYAICNSSNSATTICSCMQGFAPKNTANWEAGEYADGCVRRVELDCGEGTADTFLAVDVVKLPESSIPLVNATSDLDACSSECLENCSCTAYALSGGASVIWVTDLLDVVQQFSARQDLYIRNGSANAGKPPQSTDAASHTQKVNWSILVVIVSLLSGALLLSCFIFFFLIWRRKKRRRDIVLGRTIFFSGKLDEDDMRQDLDLPLVNFGTIAAATESFSAENKLGQGGFGPIYKGILDGDKEMAVKRLAKSSQQGVEEFKNEVMLIVKLQNRNLVRLLGCCIQGEERMLIYEYMPNRSLDAFLFEKEKAILLEWQIRYQIIVGITRGLLYLHHDSRYRIIHRDLKASNILLDKEMNPKISDFGMARLFGGDETNYNTRKVVVGTCHQSMLWRESSL